MQVTHLDQPLYRYNVGDRIVGHAYAPRSRRMQHGTVVHMRRETTIPAGYKRYLVQWRDGMQTWHDERELSPLRQEEAV